MPDEDWDSFEPVGGDLPDFGDDDGDATGVFDLENVSGVAADRKNARAFLMILAGHSSGHMQSVAGGVTLGRSERADLRVTDDGASRIHARVFTEDGVTYLQDLRSSNGTLLNGEKIQGKVQLEDGDKIQIGATCMIKFTLQDDLEAKFQKTMYEAARRDGLTKAFNKASLLTHLDLEYAFSDRHGTPLSLIMFDLDHFKSVNDTYGHLAGDHVLRVVAEIVHAAVRTEDFFARYGGEEFTVVCRGVTAKQASVLGERLRASIEHRTFTFDRVMIPVSISLGIAACPDPSIRSVSELVSAADAALYEAKRSGRNRLVIQPPTRRT